MSDSTQTGEAAAQVEPSADPEVGRYGAEAPAESRRVLLTGASGFVGGWVLRELVAKGYQPVCVVRQRDRLLRKLEPEQASRVEAVEGDLADADALRKAAEGCGAAIHLVGIIYERKLLGRTFQRVHVEGTRRVVEACTRTGVERYAHMSALGTRADGVSRYHQTKWAAEEIVRGSRLKWTMFRPSMIHGPDGEFMRMMKFFSTSKVLQPVMPYFGSGEKRIQPVDVRDVAACFVKCLSMPETIGQVYALGGPERFTWKQLYDACAEAIAGHRRIKVGVPVAVAKIAARTVIPLAPSFLVPYKFNVDQVQMSQEDSVCETGLIEETFGIKLRDFRRELALYRDQIE